MASNPGHFKKGQSGNPGGRSKVQAQMAQWIRDRTRNGEQIVEFVVQVMNGEAGDEMKTPQCRMWAADYLTDRVAGKAPQVVEMAEPEREKLDYNRLTAEEVSEYEAAARTLRDLRGKCRVIEVEGLS